MSLVNLDHNAQSLPVFPAEVLAPASDPQLKRRGGKLCVFWTSLKSQNGK